jgi:hypothetical protein
MALTGRDARCLEHSGWTTRRSAAIPGASRQGSPETRSLLAASASQSIQHSHRSLPQSVAGTVLAIRTA